MLFGLGLAALGFYGSCSDDIIVCVLVRLAGDLLLIHAQLLRNDLSHLTEQSSSPYLLLWGLGVRVNGEQGNIVSRDYIVIIFPQSYYEPISLGSTGEVKGVGGGMKGCQGQRGLSLGFWG